MVQSAKLGRKIRGLRRREGLTQVALAGKLGISPSYLNLIEHDRRPLSAALLLKLADLFDLDLRSFAGEEDGRLLEDLNEVFGDPLFEGHPVTPKDLKEILIASPDAAKAVVHLYGAYREAQGSVMDLAERVVDDEFPDPLSGSSRPADEVLDLIESNRNHFPELEAPAEALWQEHGLEVEDLFGQMARYLETKHGVRTRIEGVQALRGAVRRYDPERRELQLSVVLRRGSRNFQLATMIGLLDCHETIDRMVSNPKLSSDAARKLFRVVLGNYFAAALLMPYERFLKVAREERYDLDLLGHRFRASFEQVCHRLTAMRRKGAEGIPFHFVRVDMAGNLSKVLGSSGIRFPRFSGLCPLWNVHAAFQRPGQIRVQIAGLPDGRSFFSVARTVRKHRGGFHTPAVLHAIGLGCDVERARELVYADGMDLGDLSAAVPVGMTCRLCQRMDCKARAFPPVQMPLRIDENVRGLSFYAPPRD